MKQLRAIVFIKEDHDYAEHALKVVHSYFENITLNPEEHEIGTLTPADFVISVLNPQKISKFFLTGLNFNIHAAPPWYPGWGGIARALLEKQRFHGVCAHKMTENYDEGELIATKYFAIRNLNSYKSTYEQTMASVLECLDEACIHLLLRHASKKTFDWTGEPMTMEKVLNWLPTLNHNWKDDAIKDYSVRK